MAAFDAMQANGVISRWRIDGNENQLLREAMIKIEVHNRAPCESPRYSRKKKGNVSALPSPFPEIE